MNKILILSLLALQVMLIQCGFKAKKSCEDRISEPAVIQVSLSKSEGYPHFRRSNNDFIEGEIISVLYKGDFVATGEDNEISIDGQSFGIFDEFTLTSGDYVGTYRLGGCTKSSNEGYQCSCRSDELGADFEVQFYSSINMVVDSIRLIDSLECSNHSYACNELNLSISESNFSVNTTTESLAKGMAADYGFISVPTRGMLNFTLVNSNSDKFDFQFESDDANPWISGWIQDAESKLAIKLRIE